MKAQCDRCKKSFDMKELVLLDSAFECSRCGEGYVEDGLVCEHCYNHKTDMGDTVDDEIDGPEWYRRLKERIHAELG